MGKTKTLKAKVSASPRKRMSRGACYPFQVWSINRLGHHDCHFSSEAFCTEAQAKRYQDRHPELIGSRMIHIEIPPVEYC